MDTTDVGFLRAAYYIELVDEDYESAIAYAELFPDPLFGQAPRYKLMLLARAHRLAGHRQEAMALYDSARIVLEDAAREAVESENPWAAFTVAELAKAYAGLGRTEDAVTTGRRAGELLPISRDAYSEGLPIYYLAQVHVMLGQEDEALNQLERFLQIQHSRVGGLQPWRFDPDLEPLRDHPRYQALLEEYGSKEG